MLEKVIKQIYGDSFKAKEDLFSIAFTHSTIANMLNKSSNERFEFLGDSILNFTVSKYIYSNFLDFSEGELTKIRAKLVSTKILSKVSLNLELDKKLKINGIISEKILANTYEALITALYYSFEDKTAESEIFKFIKLTLIDRYLTSLDEITDYKTELQELLQKNGNVEIKYSSEKTEDIFTSTVSIYGKKEASGKGKTKKAAEMEAAKNVIKKFKLK